MVSVTQAFYLQFPHYKLSASQAQWIIAGENPLRVIGGRAVVSTAVEVLAIGRDPAGEVAEAPASTESSTAAA